MKMYIIVSICACFFLGTAFSETDRKNEILEHIEALWDENKFDELDQYIVDITKNDIFFPALLFEGINNYRKGAQSEDMIATFEKIKHVSTSNLSLVSPIFMDMLESSILKANRLLDIYKNNGVTKEYRLLHYNPRNLSPEKKSSKWSNGFEHLITECPSFSICSSNLAISTISSNIKQHKSVSVESTTNDKLLINGLRVSTSIEALKIDVDEICRSPDPRIYIPCLLENISDPDSSVSKMAIWAIIRIGKNSSDVIQALKDHSSKGRATSKYANHALCYLLK